MKLFEKEENILINYRLFFQSQCRVSRRKQLSYHFLKYFMFLLTHKYNQINECINQFPSLVTLNQKVIEIRGQIIKSETTTRHFWRHGVLHKQIVAFLIAVFVSTSQWQIIISIKHGTGFSSSSFICQEHIQHNVQEEQIAYGRCDKAEAQH